MSARVRCDCPSARSRSDLAGAHREWLAAAAAAAAALSAWRCASPRVRARAYFEYRVALEVEERQALVLEIAMQGVRP